MCSNEIIVTTKSLRSQYMEDIIDSNVDFLKKLFKVNIHKDEVSQEAMQSYYVNFYHKNISELCEKANQKYKCITAGDPNNIYNSSWYFMTESGNYYMVEKNKEANMYSSKTKNIVSSMSTKSYYEN